MDDDPTSDPGWPSVLGTLGWPLVPGIAIRHHRRRLQSGGADGLTLRTLFLAFAVAVAMVGAVVAVLTAVGEFVPGALPAGAVAGGVGAMGALALVGVARLPFRFVCADHQSLAGGYFTWFFLRVALAESAALVGFVGFVLTGHPGVFLLGGAFAAAGFKLLAPTAANLADVQRAVDARGCGLSLVEALRRRPGADGGLSGGGGGI